MQVPCLKTTCSTGRLRSWGVFPVLRSVCPDVAYRHADVAHAFTLRARPSTPTVARLHVKMLDRRCYCLSQLVRRSGSSVSYRVDVRAGRVTALTQGECSW